MKMLEEEARRHFGIHLTGMQMIALKTLECELLSWNERVNLTAIKDPREVRIKHFLDSFSCVMAWKESPPRNLIDVGTGAGFPGLPLKILYPGMHLTLVESIGKKAAFCQHMVDVLKLNNVDVLIARAEDVGQMPAYRESFDWAVARAVAEQSVLVEYLLPLVRVGGVILAQKGRSGPEEVQRSDRAMQILGGHLRQLITITLPEVAEDRFLVIVDKTASTPPAYPRKPGIPMKKPLT